MSGILFGAALDAQLVNNTLVADSNMFKFAFSQGVLEANMDALLSSFTAQISAREG